MRLGNEQDWGMMTSTVKRCHIEGNGTLLVERQEQEFNWAGSKKSCGKEEKQVVTKLESRR